MSDIGSSAEGQHSGPDISESGWSARGPLAAGRGLADQGAVLGADMTKGERPTLGWIPDIHEIA